MVLAAPWVSPAGCQQCRCDASDQDAHSDPSPCVGSLSGPLGGEVGGSHYFCPCKAVFGSRVSGLQPRAWLQPLWQLRWHSDPAPQSALSVPEPQFLSWAMEWSWEGQVMLDANSFVCGRRSRRRRRVSFSLRHPFPASSGPGGCGSGDSGAGRWGQLLLSPSVTSSSFCSLVCLVQSL